MYDKIHYKKKYFIYSTVSSLFNSHFHCLVAKSFQLFCAPMHCSPPGSSVHGFPRTPEYWSVLPFSSPGDLSHPGIEPVSAALAGRFFTTEPPGKPRNKEQK